MGKNNRKLLILWALIVSSCLSGLLLKEARAQADNTASQQADPKDSNPGTAWDIRKNYFLRYPVAKEHGPTESGGADEIQEKRSLGPGTVQHHASGPVFLWPEVIPAATSPVPTNRDEAIQKDLFKTFGYPVSDTQFQIIDRYNDNRLLEQLFDPEKLMWMTNAVGMVQATSAANSVNNLSRNQAASAIDYNQSYLTNFTAEAGNRWWKLRDQLFIPMAILLLLPGAVLTQVRAIVAQGTTVLGNVNPFEGIIRSIIGIFMIFASFLVVNYGIDVSNSIRYTIADEYKRIFGSDMYEDAMCAEHRAFQINPSRSNENAMVGEVAVKPEGQPRSWAHGEAEMTAGGDPCAGGGEALPDEQRRALSSTQRLLLGGANTGLTATWNVLCAFQIAYLYYLFCIGPVVAALWVWPMGQLRNALPSWIEGVVTLCFWSLFWSTTILLMACFRGVSENGAIIMTALNALANISVKYAFNFAGLVSAAGQQAASEIQKAAAGQPSGAGCADGGRGPGGETPAHPAVASSSQTGSPQIGETTGVPAGSLGGVPAVPAGEGQRSHSGAGLQPAFAGGLALSGRQSRAGSSEMSESSVSRESSGLPGGALAAAPGMEAASPPPLSGRTSGLQGDSTAYQAAALSAGAAGFSGLTGSASRSGPGQEGGPPPLLSGSGSAGQPGFPGLPGMAGLSGVTGGMAATLGLVALTTDGGSQRLAARAADYVGDARSFANTLSGGSSRQEFLSQLNGMRNLPPEQVFGAVDGLRAVAANNPSLLGRYGDLVAANPQDAGAIGSSIAALSTATGDRTVNNSMVDSLTANMTRLNAEGLPGTQLATAYEAVALSNPGSLRRVASALDGMPAKHLSDASLALANVAATRPQELPRLAGDMAAMNQLPGMTDKGMGSTLRAVGSLSAYGSPETFNQGMTAIESWTAKGDPLLTAGAGTNAIGHVVAGGAQQHLRAAMDAMNTGGIPAAQAVSHLAARQAASADLATASILMASSGTAAPAVAAVVGTVAHYGSSADVRSTLHALSRVQEANPGSYQALATASHYIHAPAAHAAVAGDPRPVHQAIAHVSSQAAQPQQYAGVPADYARAEAQLSGGVPQPVVYQPDAPAQPQAHQAQILPAAALGAAAGPAASGMAFAWSDGSGAISSQMAAGAAAEQSAMRAQMAGELAAREAQMHSQMESARARLEGDMAAREAQMRSAAGPGQVESSYSTGGLLPAERLPQPVAVMPLAATQASYQRWEAASQVIAGEQLVAYQQLPPSAASVQPASSSYYAAPPPPDSSMTGSLYDQVAGRIYWLSKRQRSRQEEEEYRRLMSQYGHILQGDGST